MLHVTEGDPLTIVCELTRTPDVIRWIKNGQRVTPDGNLTMDDEDKKCTLSLLCAQEDHAGQYECNVGTDACIFQVHVDGEFHQICSLRGALCCGVTSLSCLPTIMHGKQSYPFMPNVLVGLSEPGSVDQLAAIGQLPLISG